ncbi:MAG TPA: hypothetical protein PLV68_18270, partial [Ilumatobacteraceae bacterium]|nr:hypothetical protein [Ilumatobacteraceae bacterium]
MRAAVEQALADDGSTAASAAPLVTVEAFTPATAAVAVQVVVLGGVVTGMVEGHVVQAEIPAAVVGALAADSRVDSLRSPRYVARPQTVTQPAVLPRTDVGPGFGPVVTQSVALTNAATWQAAGIDGSVKIGIVDFFDFGLWSLAENGPLPDANHRFCRDSSADPSLCDPGNNDGINNGDGYEHGVAVAQIVRDMAPAAELFLATAGTVSDLQAAIDWFAANGGAIVNRSV